jgi:putative transposase
MRYRMIDAEKACFPLSLLCRLFEVSRAGYYAWRRRPVSARAATDASLTKALEQAHTQSRRTYGSPRLHAALQTQGHRHSRKRIIRLMREARISAVRKRPFRVTTDSKHSLPVAENLLARDFSVGAVQKVWTTDITYISTHQGWLYLAVILDCGSRRVVGWGMSERIDTDLVTSAFTMACQGRRPPEGLMHHSDRGSQYASLAYQKALKDAGLLCSMSRKGNCWDNAITESFFGRLKDECVHRHSFTSHAHAKRVLFEHIEVFYNRQRLHSALGYRTPVQYEQDLLNASTTLARKEFSHPILMQC